jgi:hypothetical protein
MFFLKIILRIFRNATPKVNYLFNRMQIPASIALALSHGSNDVQKSIGLIGISFVILGLTASFHVPFWVIASCGVATALGQQLEDGKLSKPCRTLLLMQLSMTHQDSQLQASSIRLNFIPRCSVF